MLILGRNKSAGVGLGAAIAGAMLLALMFAGLAASKASAFDCTGGPILGEGASLQGVAQNNVWIPGFHTAAICGPTGPAVTYKAEGSGAGLAAWGFTDGTFDASRSFAASDDAPTAAQIATAQTAIPGEQNVLVIPVAQTAISIAANPPVECEIEEISNATLERVMRGLTRNWGQIATANGAGCKGSPITRVVRFDGSGTTYQFKNYLFKINKAPLECTDNGKGEKMTWQELEPNPGPNTVWPEAGVAGCTKSNVSAITNAGKKGGGALIEKLNETDGGFGYAALPDAEAKKNPSVTTVLRLQNNGLGNELNAVYPATEGNNANCAAVYNVPEAAQKGHSGENVDWSQVFGANTAVGGEAYPLCTITFDFAMNTYEGSGIEPETVKTLHTYLDEYVVGVEGQKALENHVFYNSLPSVPTKPSRDVLGAARFAASKMP